MVEFRDIIRPGISRGLDFVTLEELVKRTGISPGDVLKFALNEMLCNALDKKDASEISINLQVESSFYKLSISDNGSRKLTKKEEVKLIFDFENRGSSKRGILAVSRGYLGNALKCILGYTYALAERKGLNPPPIIVRSGGHEYVVTVKVNRIMEVAEPHIEQRETEDDGLTTFTVKFPKEFGEDINSLIEVIHATSMVNPSRKITYNILGNSGMLGSLEAFLPLEKETSILWYKYKQLRALSKDYAKAGPDAKLSAFMSIFMGFARTRTILDVIKELNDQLKKQNKKPREDTRSISKMDQVKDSAIMITEDDEQSNLEMNRDKKVFVPISFSTPLRDVPDEALRLLFAIMKSRSRPIDKRSAIRSILRSVGKKNFENLRVRNGWENLKYVRMAGIRIECPYPKHLHGEDRCPAPDHVEYPFIVEVAVFNRKRDDTEGLKVYQCINFMASTEDVFSDLFDISYRLGRVGITEKTPVTVVIHLVCPVLQWLNYGKTTLGEDSDGYMYSWGDSISKILERTFNKVLPIPKVPKIYWPPPPKRPLSWVPHGKLGNPIYEMRLRDFAREILAIDSRRTRRIKLSSRGWCYALEGLGKIDKGEFDACQKAINDCRKIGLLPIDFTAEDQDITRRFAGLHEAADPTVLLKEMKRQVKEMLRFLPSSTTDYWEEEKYYVMMVVEKGDIRNLFKPICDEYHVPIANSKGWAPILLRYHIATLSKMAEERGLTPVLLLFYDHDPAGLKISRTFRKNLHDISRATGWRPDRLIIDRFGLNKEDIDKYNLTWIPNLKSSSGREIRDPEYVARYGRRKCESNALFKNDETLKAAEEICRQAIEKYYGPDAKERFRGKEEKSKENLKEVYENPVWRNFLKSIDELVRSLSKPKGKERKELAAESREVEVEIERGEWGQCPRCGEVFDYDEQEVDAGRVLRCRRCGLLMKLKWGSER